MRFFGIIAFTCSCIFGAVNPSFPTEPDARLTPGAVCSRPNAYRYPEKIPYCNRNVSGSTKADVIEKYDAVLGFKIQALNRMDFKIDHFIPLCAGGDNAKENLWPQHKSVYQVTDQIEQKICVLMERGKMLQVEAISIIKNVKHDLREAPIVIRNLDDRLK